MLSQVVQVAGSLLILGAFVAGLLGRIDQTSYRYLIPNAVGSAVLAATAVVNVEWGFILLEGVWAMVSLYSIARKATRRSGHYGWCVKVISQGEFRNHSAAVMDAVEAGATYRITRNGVEVAELRPVVHGRRLSAEELVERQRKLPPVDYMRMRQEADGFFGTEDGCGADDLPDGSRA